jgi:hypothetical protein
MRFPLFLGSFAAAALGVGLTAVPLALAEDGDDEKPILEWNFDAPPSQAEKTMLALGDDGTWEAAIDDGDYVVENHSDDDSIRYVQLSLNNDGKPIDTSVSSVDVDVDGTFEGEEAGAGILYRFDPDTQTYLAFVLTKNGYMILKRGEDGVQTISQGAAAHPSDGATLEVNTLDSGALEFRVEDKVVATIPGDEFKGSHVGMVAVGRGEFDFDNFQVYSPDAE